MRRDGQQGSPRTARARQAREAHQLPVFYRQVVAELRKVVWPTQEQLVTYFIVVMVFVVVHDGDRLAARPRASASWRSRLHWPQRPIAPRPGPDRPQQPDPIRVMEQDVSEQRRAGRDAGRAPTTTSSETDERHRGDRRRASRTTSSRAARREPTDVEDQYGEADDGPDDRGRPAPGHRGDRRGHRPGWPTSRAPTVATDDARGPAEEPPTRSPRPPDDRRGDGRADEAADADVEPATTSRRGRRRRGADEAGRRAGATRSRSSAASCGPSPATGSWCTPTPAWRTG